MPLTVVPDAGITFSRADASALAQAKAANAAGQWIVLRTLGVDPPDVDRLYLAGGFANHVNVEHAIEIGFLAPVPADRVVKAGNASVRGARELLLSASARERLEQLVRRVEHVELELTPDFFDLFVEGCQFKPLPSALAEPMAAPLPERTAGPSLRQLLADPGRFVIVAELVTSRGLITAEAGQRVLGLARDLAAHPRIDVVSITDNPGGNPMLAPDTVASELAALGQEAIVHVSCKDLNRNALQSRGWKLASEGLRNVLCLSGDYPIAGYRGTGRPGVRHRLGRALADVRRHEHGARPSDERAASSAPSSRITSATSARSCRST